MGLQAKDKTKANKKKASVDPLNGAGKDDDSQQTPSKVEPSADKQKLKKQKKKKEADKAVGLDTSGDATGVPVQQTNGEDQVKKSKKKRKQEDVDAVDAAPPPAEQAVDPPKKKKKKKKKQTENGDAPAAAAVASGKPSSGPTGRASIGAADLASSSPQILKHCYNEHPDVTAMTDAAVRTYLEEREIAVEGCSVRPVPLFSQIGLPDDLMHALKTFKQPSPIQAQCWPIAMSGLDLIGIAATGSGKTLAFGLPALRHIQVQREHGVVSGRGPFVLVKAPTRELAQQICAVFDEAGAACGMRALCIYGGVPKGPQAQALARGVEVAVGTPGRVVDLMETGTRTPGTTAARWLDRRRRAASMQEITFLVLDEADRMLDLGFEPHIRAVASATRADRQTLMFSATWPPEIQKLAAEFLCSPVKVTIGSLELAASHSVAQTVEVIEQYARDARLLQLLDEHHSSRKNRIIIFVLYKKEAPRVEGALRAKGWRAAAIHGDISQDARNRAVEEFKSAKVPLLIATDVAARGLDIPDVEVVINYSFPLTVEDYVHRIGRTGRAGKSGKAHTFFVGKNDKPRAGELVNVLREAGQPVPKALMAFGTAVKKKESKMYGAHFKDVDMNAKATKVKFADSDDD